LLNLNGMLRSNKKKIKILNGNIIRNPETGRYIAFFDEFPELTAEADSQKEAKERLFRGLVRIFNKNKEKADPMPLENTPVTHFELSTAI
jgi:predicted RNase H-like HicB family nuclease